VFIVLLHLHVTYYHIFTLGECPGLHMQSNIQGEHSVSLNFLCCTTCTTTIIHSYFKTSVFIVLKEKFLSVFLSSFFFPLFHTLISECDFTPLQCFYKVCTQSNRQMALGWLMHRMHCGTTILRSRTLERRLAQELTNITA
jgi:hypothetical protein